MTSSDQFEFDDSLIASLRSANAQSPDHVFLRFGGDTFTFAEALGHTETMARGLLELGMQPGDRVGVILGNSPSAIWTWLSLSAARLIDVPFNPEAQGNRLAYLMEDAEPRLLIGTERYLEVLADSVSRDPEIVVCIDSAARPFGDRAKQVTLDELMDLGARSAVTLSDPRPDETATIMYTSGTTGPSKGVMLPQRSYPAVGALFTWNVGLDHDDVFYTAQPLFHVDARTYLSGVLHSRSTAAIGERFSATNFWSEVRGHDATVVGIIGTMMWYLYKQPPTADDAAHRVRMVSCSSVPYQIQAAFAARFGVEINEGYGMTESAVITINPPERCVPSRIGGPAPHLTVAVMDEDDNPVSAGHRGEICFRPSWSHTTMQGYWRKPVETVEAWRNLWFHTGDLGRQDSDGQFEYVGRKKDAIRCRGEILSAWEVEQAISAHPDVLEVAAIGVASEGGEEDVAVVLVPLSGRSPDPLDLLRFVESDLPRFALPRYIEFVDELPKTPSARIAKDKVRERGISDAAWDANASPKRP